MRVFLIFSCQCLLASCDLGQLFARGLKLSSFRYNYSLGSNQLTINYKERQNETDEL